MWRPKLGWKVPLKIQHASVIHEGLSQSSKTPPCSFLQNPNCLHVLFPNQWETGTRAIKVYFLMILVPGRHLWPAEMREMSPTRNAEDLNPTSTPLFLEYSCFTSMIFPRPGNCLSHFPNKGILFKSSFPGKLITSPCLLWGRRGNNLFPLKLLKEKKMGLYLLAVLLSSREKTLLSKTNTDESQVER